MSSLLQNCRSIIQISFKTFGKILSKTESAFCPKGIQIISTKIDALLTLMIVEIVFDACLLSEAEFRHGIFPALNIVETQSIWFFEPVGHMG